MSVQAARTMHERMARAVFQSPIMSFFETTASGTILNRFSSDIFCVDEMLAPLLNMFFITVVRTLIALIIIMAGEAAFQNAIRECY
jgi:ABC-type multidrug transport system fused ATPase/permease subunit